MLGIQIQNISSREDFGRPSHSAASELYYYDTACCHLHDSNTLVIDHNTRCISFFNYNDEVGKLIYQKIS